MRKSAFLLAAVLSLVAYAQIESSVPVDEEDPYVLLCGEADAAVAEGRFGDAAQRLTEAMGMRPDNPQNVLLMSNLGMIYSYMGRDTLALDVLDEALRQAPSLRPARNNRGKVLLKLGRDKEAFGEFGKVLEVDSINFDARFYHGTIALYSGDLATAEADYAVLSGLLPQSIVTARALGMLYSLTGRNVEALPYLQRLVDEEPAPEYFAALAGAQLATGRVSEASATLATGLRDFPSDPELYYYRAMLNRDRFMLDDAHADAKRAVQLGANPRRVEQLFK